MHCETSFIGSGSILFGVFPEDLYHDIDQDSQRPQAGCPAEESGDELGADAGGGSRVSNVLGVPTPNPDSAPRHAVVRGGLDHYMDGECVFGLKRKIAEMKALIAARKASEQQPPTPPPLKVNAREEVEAVNSEQAAKIKERMAQIKSMMELLGPLLFLIAD